MEHFVVSKNTYALLVNSANSTLEDDGCEGRIRGLDFSFYFKFKGGIQSEEIKVHCDLFGTIKDGEFKRITEQMNMLVRSLALKIAGYEEVWV